MTKTTPHWIAIAMLVFIIAGIGIKVVVLGSTSSTKDGRTAINLKTNERQAVLKEMRLLLQATQKIIEGVANNDPALVQKAATAVGKQAVSTMDFSLKAKLPIGFKKLGFATHGAFDKIAEMSKKGADNADIMGKLGLTMNNCIACHESYQLPSLPL